jgi:hypothetical protein
VVNEQHPFGAEIDRRRAVAAALIDFARSLANVDPSTLPAFTADPNANELVVSNPFAFQMIKHSKRFTVEDVHRPALLTCGTNR